MNPDFDTQAAKDPSWRINLDAWEHWPRADDEAVECPEIRPHYNGDNPRWNCAVCSVRVRVKP